jgi:hypothetical protein
VFGASDLPAFFADMGVDVSYSGKTTQGLFDQQQVQRIIAEAGGILEVTETSVLIQAGTLGTLSKDATIVVDGVSYKIRTVRSMDDGQLTAIAIA